MDINSMLALFGTLLLLAFYPGVSSLTVIAKSATDGFTHACLTTLGIVTADIIFISVAILGLSIIAETMNSIYFFFKYIGGSYLIWLGAGFWKSNINIAESAKMSEPSRLSSYITGLLITFADIKAIFFYLVFFPAFVDLTTLSFLQSTILIGISISAVLIAKLSYALLADRARALFSNPGSIRVINAITASIMIGTGFFLMLKT